MIQTVEAVIDERGGVRLLQPVEIAGSHRALVTILDEHPVLGRHEAILPSKPCSSEDRDHSKESTAIADAEELARRRKAVDSVRAFRTKMFQKYDVQPDSTEIIREARDNPRV